MENQQKTDLEKVTAWATTAETLWELLGKQFQGLSDDNRNLLERVASMNRDRALYLAGDSKINNPQIERLSEHYKKFRYPSPLPAETKE